MTEEDRYIFTEHDFDTHVGPFQAIGQGGKFEWRIWNTYTDRSSGMGGPCATEEEAYAEALQAAIKEAERLNAMP